MKRIFIPVIAAILVLCLCACENDGATGIGQGKKAVTETSENTAASTETAKKEGSSETSKTAESTSSTESQTSTTAATENSNSSETGEITVTEEMYVTYINEIYTNYQRYEGYKITIEGMYAKEETDSAVYHYVYRTGPGCCGNDGAMCGFEFTTDDPIPKPNDWIKVSGTLRSYEENGQLYLTLDNSECEILDESMRGAEVVR